ncbi:FadR family transcriptional regulator [Peribacillus psychrosaccharolyticus]|uniref:FadR family transcriptional regulator n=1 Tax=Peribacillus psychrosaccharolyticus TaxID=1407 RepID=A0A974NKK3_PERPY|nr:GntR family transcriptional regulator [Peribacillus psychrosaccharolyticus]MEC2054701.1 GntR family transcriptional regulator [Peribacillus psychrosaccharolyticus]MED3744072.1 GntR family transcriptional regulator [Peribacillus psychrosaccharolyticus]QQS99566.1 FadR family transcriptional regulator [Peribacillus psychrosaccharolyticus]
MTEVNGSTSKIYLEVVEKLRNMIEKDGLNPGDKIPSERELSERLSVGRSSVREALRALELLGLIETRRGEGTFIKDFQEHKLVELLGTFFLQNTKVKKDLAETKQLLELDCIQIILLQASSESLDSFAKWAEQGNFDDQSYFGKLLEVNPNKLLERMWSIVNTYAQAAQVEFIQADLQAYIDLALALRQRQKAQTEQIYRERIRQGVSIKLT